MMLTTLFTPTILSVFGECIYHKSTTVEHEMFYWVKCSWLEKKQKKHSSIKLKLSCDSGIFQVKEMVTEEIKWAVVF